MAPTGPRSLRERALSFGRRNMSPGPRSPSPTFSETTNISAMNFGANGPSKIITRADLKASLQAYERLMDTCASYRGALLAMSRATAEFADAVETCAGLKGPSYEAGTRLQATSGLHHLIGNSYHVLAETLDRNFEKPMRQHLETYRTIVTERSSSYERALKEKSNIIRQTERRSMNRKERNLQTFRDALAILQRQVDELDELKAAHYAEIVEHEDEVWDVVQGKMCLVVRSTMDVYDKLTSKASDPVIEPMLQSIPDPFDSYGPPQSEDQIISILPPLSIMHTAPSSSTASLAQTPEPSSSLASSSYNPASIIFSAEPSEWADVPPSPVSASPRSASPTTPVVRRHSVPAPSYTGHTSRKSESKLRSALSVIDESNSRHSTEAEVVTTSVPQANENPTSPLIQPQPQKRPNFNWTFPFPSYGHSPYNGEDINGDTTPRNSTFVPSAAPTAPDTSDLDNDAESNVPVPS